MMKAIGKLLVFKNNNINIKQKHLDRGNANKQQEE